MGPVGDLLDENEHFDPEDRPKRPKRRSHRTQPLIFRDELLVSGSVVRKKDASTPCKVLVYDGFCF